MRRQPTEPRCERPQIHLQPLVIQHKPFDDELAQPLGSPDAERGVAMRLHPVADRQDNIEVVEPGLTGLAVNSSYPEFPDT